MTCIREMEPSQRPRERLLTCGPEVLSDAELIAVLLRTGAVGRGVVADAHHLLAETGGLAELARLGARELVGRRGVGPAKASVLLAALELGRRLAATELAARERLDRPEEAGRYLCGRLAGAREEVFGAVHLDARHRVLAIRTYGRGTRNHAPVDPAEIFRSALLDHAVGLVAFHNHPSGDLEPSGDDLALTRRLAHGGETVGVSVLDHVIVGQGRWLSLRQTRPEVFTPRP